MGSRALQAIGGEGHWRSACYALLLYIYLNNVKRTSKTDLLSTNIKMPIVFIRFSKDFSKS